MLQASALTRTGVSHHPVFVGTVSPCPPCIDCDLLSGIHKPRERERGAGWVLVKRCPPQMKEHFHRPFLV